MSRSKTIGAFGAITAIAAVGVATSGNASAEVVWDLPTQCTITYTGANAPANASFEAPLVAAYAGHGDVTKGEKGSYAHVDNTNTQITIPADAAAGLYKSGVLTHPSTSGAEYYTIDGKPASAPFDVSVPRSWNEHGVYVVSADGPATNVPVSTTNSTVKLAHTGTSITWANNGITAHLMCGTASTGTTTPPTTTPPTTTGPTTGPTSKPTTGPTTKPTTGPTTKPTTGPTTGPTAPAGNPGTTPQGPGSGPKVQTDMVSQKGGINVLGVGAAAGAVVAAGGALLVARRRSN